MSAWSEAVWIIKKLQKNFNFEEDIKVYTQNLNNLNQRVNTLNDKVAADEAEIRNVISDMETRATTIRAKAVNGKPDTEDGYSKGTIWIVLKG